MTQRTDSCERR